MANAADQGFSRRRSVAVDRAGVRARAVGSQEVVTEE
jgi:hypothetical protein